VNSIANVRNRYSKSLIWLTLILGSSSAHNLPVLANEVAFQNAASLLDAHTDPFKRVYAQADKLIKSRKYQDAKPFLDEALKKTNSMGANLEHFTEARLLMAEYLNYNEHYRQANSLLDGMRGKVAGCPSDKLKAAFAYQHAQCLMMLGKENEAERLSNQSSKLYEQLRLSLSDDRPSTTFANEIGKAYLSRGRALLIQGFYEEAKPILNRARKELENEPGNGKLDLAEALTTQSNLMRCLGQHKMADALAAESQEIKDQATAADKTISGEGEVKFDWHPSTYGCHEIIDNEFPLRYMVSNNIRVASTIIDLWELTGVVISVTNLDDHRTLVGLGEANAFKTNRLRKTSLTYIVQPLVEVNHQRIDRVRREQNMWDLTQDRPWLANIQKTRSYRGLVPTQGHDLFRGPNVFGVWGQWPGIAHIVSKGLGNNTSRENIFLRYQNDDKQTDTGLIRSQAVQQSGMTPIYLEPFESRTGELFFIAPRGEDIRVKVTVGNATYSFPFHVRKRRI
jgi:tetratricopeptide (TPR) repeat protein